MAKFHITMIQLLDDGDTTLVEEHDNIDGYYVTDIIAEYHNRAVAHTYVESYSVTVVIKR